MIARLRVNVLYLLPIIFNHFFYLTMSFALPIAILPLHFCVYYVPTFLDTIFFNFFYYYYLVQTNNTYSNVYLQ